MNTQPEADQYEIAFFGPGYGEGILIRIPNYGWVQIDSCEYKGRPFSLFYLQSLGLNPNDCLKDIIISHLHDDHIKGLAKTIEACPQAKIFCSAAMENRRFALILAQTIKTGIKASNGLRELTKIISLKQDLIPLLEHSNILSPVNQQEVLFAISPSGQTNLFFRSVSGNPPIFDESDLNLSSVAIWAKLGDRFFLFGSDLEENSDPNVGWARAVQIGTSNRLNKASFFKIPHHGSPNGHSDIVWSHLVDTAPKSFCTLYQKGNKKLPQKSDIERIKNYCQTLYLTADPTILKSTKELQKGFNNDNRVTVKPKAQDGFVRLRYRVNNPETIEIFGSAKCIDS